MSEPSVQLDHIKPILMAGAELGIDVRDVLKDRPIAKALDRDPAEVAIPIADYFRIQRAIAHVSDDLTANISSRKLMFKTGHFIVAQMQNANSLLTTIENLVEHINMMHGDAYNSLRFSDANVSLVINDSTFPYRFKDNVRLLHLIGDCLMIKIFALLDSLTKGAASASLKKVRLKRVRDEQLQPQNRFWSVPIEYGCSNYELVFDFDEACRPVRIGDTVDLSTRGLFSRVISYLDDFDPTKRIESVTARIIDLIEDGTTRQSDIASKLDMSVATLRRRMDESGQSFRDLVLETNLRRAEAMLRRGCSIAQTSEELHYSDVRAFNRAFKRWKGLTPSAFAQSCRSAITE